MRDRVAGALLFLPVPLVLWLYTRAPLGVAASLAAGTVIMVTHRLYARPFARGRADRRCLWCGGAATAGVSVAVDEPPGRTGWRACSAAHAARLDRILGAAQGWAVGLRLGILGGLVVLLLGGVLVATGIAGGPRYPQAVAIFKVAVALAVLPLGWLAPLRAPRGEGPRHVPFPVHIQALVGTVVVVWLFRLVGLLWLYQGVVSLWRS